MIKRAFLILGLVVFAFVAVTVVFLSRFNPDIYRPQIQTYLKNHLHQEVEIIGPLSVEWKGMHPTFAVQGLRVKNSESRQVIFQSKKAWAGVRLSGIFLHKIVMDRLILEEAHFSFLHQENGNWNWNFLGNKKPEFSFLPLAGWKIQADSVEARNVSIYYADQSQLPYFHHEWQGLTLRLFDLEPDSCRIQILPENRDLLKGLELRFVSPQQLLIRGDFNASSTGEGEIRNPLQEGRFSLKLGLQSVDLKALGMRGEGNIHAEAFGEGFHPESLKRTLIVKGDAAFRDGKIFNKNIPAELIKTISLLPGFLNLTRQPFRGKFEAMSQKEGTGFENLKMDYRISNGRLYAENFELENQYYRIEADGNLNLMENTVEVKGDCYFKGEFAAHLISRTRDMEVLMNPAQELEIPFVYKGAMEKFKISADLFYIANRLIQVRGEQLASRGIQKINDFLEGYHP